jgi:hypothetical protein
LIKSVLEFGLTRSAIIVLGLVVFCAAGLVAFSRLNIEEDAADADDRTFRGRRAFSGGDLPRNRQSGATSFGDSGRRGYVHRTRVAARGRSGAYSEVEKMGGKRWDTSSLLARLER